MFQRGFFLGFRTSEHIERSPFPLISTPLRGGLRGVKFNHVHLSNNQKKS